LRGADRDECDEDRDPLRVMFGLALSAAVGNDAAEVVGRRSRCAGHASPQNDVLRPAGKGKLGPAGESAPIVGFDVTVTDDAGCKTMLGFLD
jgi:hypothetical protein